jgi:hypothetical protein
MAETIKKLVARSRHDTNGIAAGQRRRDVAPIFQIGVKHSPASENISIARAHSTSQSALDIAPALSSPATISERDQRFIFDDKEALPPQRFRWAHMRCAPGAEGSLFCGVVSL